jgi:branched-chain amino acid transport system substrate-binding protein
MWRGSSVVVDAEIDGARRGFLQKIPIAGAKPRHRPARYYLGGWGYAYLQVLQQAIEGTKSLNDDTLAEYLRSHAFSTIMAADIKFGKDGEWTKSGVMQVQYHDITDGANLDTWRGMSYQTVLMPADQKTGNVIYPYEKALG